MGAVPLTLESVGCNPGRVSMYGSESSRWVVAAMLISVILLGIPLQECGVRDTNRRMGTKMALSEGRAKTSMPSPVLVVAAVRPVHLRFPTK